MFVVVRAAPYRRRLFERSRREKPIRLREIHVPNGAPFYDAAVPVCGRLTAARLAALPKLPLLLSCDTVPDGALRVFRPSRLPLLCAAGTVSAHLRAAGLKSRRSSFCAVDPNGALCGHTACLLHAAGDVRIVTRRPQRFAPDVECAMRQFGAALTVGTDASLADGCDALLCEDTAALPATKQTGTIYCLRNGANLPGAVCLTGFRLIEPYASLCPGDTDALLFASALYELCGVGVLTRCRFDGIS